MSNPLVAINSPDGKYLEDYALKRYWANPRLEANLVWNPSKLTSNLPKRGSFKYQGYSISMPDKNSRWHVYSMHAANIPSVYFSYNADTLQYWQKVSDVVTDNNALITFYEDNGLVYPNSLIYIRALYNGLLLFAVYAEDYANLKLRTDKLKVHFYANKSELNVVVNGIENKGDSTFTTWWNQMRSYQNLGVGYVSVFVNGLFLKDPSIADIKVGDYVEFTYDSSVLYVNEWELDQLDSFTDDKNPEALKEYYLLMNWDPSVDGVGEKPYSLHYKNDISLYVIEENSKKGVRVKAGAGVNLKQLTHQDLALGVEVVDYYHQQLRDEFISQVSDDNSISTSDLKIVSITREDGQEQYWEGDMNRVTELYLLGDKELISNALLGITATVEEWLAKNLIYNRYITMLECEYGYLDGLTIWDGLGYYACDNVINRMPITQSSLTKPESTSYTYSHTQREAHVQITYNKDTGKMLEIADYVEVDALSFDSSKGLYEVYIGSFARASDDIDRLNQPTVELTDGVWWHFFVATRNLETNKLDWKEISRYDPLFEQYATIDSNNILRWNVDYTTYSTAVRSSDTIYLLAEGVSRHVSDCVFQFPTSLPFGETLVILNNRPLVYGVDYIVEWPYIAIVSKKHILETGVNNYVNPYIHARGFPSADGKLVFNGEVGFVEYGLLSVNDRYKLNGWRNYHLSVDGSLKTLENTSWEEDVNRYRVGNSSVNGVPYQISYPFSYTLTTLEEYLYVGSKLEDDEIDSRVSDCLSSYIPGVNSDTPSTFPEKYELFSPFTHKILMDMKDGKLTFTYSEIAVHGLDVLLDSYLYLLNVCPTQKDEHIRWDICQVHAHGLNAPMGITADQYRILEAINKHYLKNKVSITQSVRISRT